MQRFSRTPKKTERARDLRKSMTRAEGLLWLSLRGRKLGESFRRQHPIGPYFADFYCARLKLTIELDGGQHLQMADRDAARAAFMGRLGIATIRFWNLEVLEDLDEVCREIGWAILRRRYELGLRA